MKYFTVASWSGDDESTWPSQAYRKHLEDIRSQIPPWFMDPDFSLHDSCLRLLQLDVSRRELTIEVDDATSLRDGAQNQLGRARLEFWGVSVLETTANPEMVLPGPGGFGDWGYDEIDVAVGEGLEFRAVFSSAIELRVVFQTFAAEWFGNQPS